jgi:glycine C-acetyltransferase
MSHDRLDEVLEAEVSGLVEQGTDKGAEVVVLDVLPPSAGLGQRFVLEGHPGDFLRMNSNSYLGLSHHPAVTDAEESATRRFGAGPGAVRFISGTYAAHLELEERISGFHSRESSMIFSSAYATVLSTLMALVSSETAVFSDELNHSCIINGLRMSRPASRSVYKHLDFADLDRQLGEAAGKARRAVVVTDGVFSMRGDFADLAALNAVAGKHDSSFDENVVVVVDDSHGVGALGERGRGTEEESSSDQVDVLVGTLGKAFGVNGGYVTGSSTLIRFLRERSPTYIYSNPITVGEASAASMAISIVDSPEGGEMLHHLRLMTEKFEHGVVEAGFETIPGPHPVVPLMVRDTEKTAALVDHLFENKILATGLNFPVVPKGDEEIRFQINADHTSADIEQVLAALRGF